MARLTADEEKQLKKLQQKREAPDTPAAGRSLNISIDLGDEKQVERAQRLGLLDMFEDDDDGQGDNDNQGGDDTPKRRGYFQDDS